MRIERLDLLKYGKFTGRTVAMPHSERDFHVIVGPNEAGKSTLRAAVLDLLFGFPKSPPQAFVHAMNELRVGAVIEHGGNRLEFHRTKGLKNTVRSPTDAPLLEGALNAFLGPTDRVFFEQMFGLDHERLVLGGHSILSAGSDVGKILFAAASGIEGVSRVRAALEAEGDTLWSPRKSKDRTYYAAQEEFDVAAAAAKTATVRSKDWADAHAALSNLEAALATTRTTYSGLQHRSNTLQRVRRVAPYLVALREKREELEQFGTIPDLPATAEQTLNETERKIALAEAAKRTQLDSHAEATAKLAGISLDTALLGMATDIQALDELRLQLRAHEGDITRREADVTAQWKTACEAASQLDGSMATSLTEAGIRDRLPTLPQRKTLERLISQHGALAAAQQAATQAERVKAAELQRVLPQLQELEAVTEPLALAAALAAAAQLGDAAMVRQHRESERDKREAAWRSAHSALGAWSFDCVASLRAMTPPSPETLDALHKEQASDDADSRVNARALAALRAEVQTKALDVAQFRETHHLVTRAEVLEKRNARDARWAAIKQDGQVSSETATGFERLVGDADRAADGREATAQEAATLQAKLHEQRRLELKLSEHEEQRDRLERASRDRAERWTTLAEACGLVGMRQDAVASWIEARKAALAACDALEESHRACREWEDLTKARASALEQAFTALGRPIAKGLPLATLVLEASTFVQSVGAARARRTTLQQLFDDATLALDGLRTTLTEATARMARWTSSWDLATEQMSITRPGGAAVDLGQAEGALELIARIEAALTEIDKLRRERIDTMRADLARLATEADRLAKAVAPELIGRPPAEIAIEMARRLALANDAKAEAKRLAKAATDAQAKVHEANSTITALQAGLSPLLKRAGATSLDELAAAIAKANAARQIQAAIAAAERGLHDGCDGLSTAQLQAEADAVQLDQVSALVQDLASQMDDLRDRQGALSAEHATAAAGLAQIAGSADAARSEGRKQEALARMADAVERYVKVTTAAHLLKWSIERYRETRQGPMLARAGTIFAGLTGNSFESLVVDFDSEALKLQGRRSDGTRVDVDGMSEGTRDQLYLALRLAALDLHLGQAHALPFIADDLFVNFDDRRARAGLAALGELARKTQVIFLTHHEHLLPLVREVFGPQVDLVAL